jgi:hypothetical protein
MFKKILRSWVFWVAVLIGLLGGASFWLPYLGILIALLTIVSAVLQGYENQRTQEEITTRHVDAIAQIQRTQEDIITKHVDAIVQIQISRDDALRQIEIARKEERFLTQWATRTLVGIVWTFNWFGYDGYIKRWLRNQLIENQ